MKVGSGLVADKSQDTHGKGTNGTNTTTLPLGKIEDQDKKIQ